MPAFEPRLDQQAVRDVVMQAAERMQDNYPYAHPLYAGQMLKPPHPVARTAYAMAQWVNPNNHALDGGRASSALEKEAVANIAAMFGWPGQYLGHLTSGGTMANLEALWIAGKLHPEKTIVASQQAHYTHSRITEVLQIPFESIAADNRGRMDMQALEAVLQRGQVGTVVATLGTTGLGAIDPLAEILVLQETYNFRIHVDCAYGGYFKIAGNLGLEGQAAFARIDRVDSIVVDPHKHGLQPYGCGCVLFRDPSVGSFYNHDSPYTYFTSDDLHLGEISLECSRAGASAVALWATQQLLPMDTGGEFAIGLEMSREAALKLYSLVCQDSQELSLFEPELDIVVWAPAATRASDISALSSRVFEAAAGEGLHLAILKLPAAQLRSFWPDVEFDQELVTLLRSCLMKPEHLEWLDRIWAIYKSVR
ncbi:MAG: aspartate aminotransferase family protein [Proteobacteria bacterium]|nr:aspartate aminotransferase family protein [Pseudomonadota bacterium]